MSGIFNQINYLTNTSNSRGCGKLGIRPQYHPSKILVEKSWKCLCFLWKSRGKLYALAFFTDYATIKNMKDIVLALIAIIPTTATALSTIYLNRQRANDKKSQEQRDARADAKSSIQNMITQDIIRAEVLGKMPENRTDIEDEYTIYHNNGGNGKITRQVNEYYAWYDQFKPSKNNPKRIDASTREFPENYCVRIDGETAQKVRQVIDELK